MAVDAVGDINGGRMNGFIASVESGHPDTDRLACHMPITTSSQLIGVLNGPPCLDVMGYHDAREIPHYWAYARNFVLQDHMFEPVQSWSLPAHLYMMSGVVGQLPERAEADDLQDRQPGQSGRRRQTDPRATRPRRCSGC